MRISDWSSDVCSSDVDTTYVGNYALLNVIDDLKRIPGVGDASLLGELDYSMRIWLRPDKMARYGLTTRDVAAAIREQNRSEEHTSELQSLMRTTYAVSCLKKKNTTNERTD